MKNRTPQMMMLAVCMIWPIFADPVIAGERAQQPIVDAQGQQILDPEFRGRRGDGMVPNDFGNLLSPRPNWQHTQSSGASILYASTNEGSPSEGIYIIDQTTGQAAFLGDSGMVQPRDLTSDWRPDSFRIWACESFTNELFTIDPDTGAGAAVGPFGTTPDMRTLAFDAQTDRLFGSTTDLEDKDVLYEVDPETGSANLIGPVGFANLFALGFDLTGTLYAVAFPDNVLLTIDTNTGAGSLVGNTNVDAITDIAVRPEDGIMFAVATTSDSIYTLDLTTGQATLVGPYDAGLTVMVGLAFSPGGPDPCECVNGRVTLCHIPPGNFANARTITVSCAARDRHLAHGDSCGPCEDGGG